MAGLRSYVNRPGIWFTNEEGYVNSFEEVKQVINDLELRTRSRFVIYSSNVLAQVVCMYVSVCQFTVYVYLVFTVYF